MMLYCCPLAISLPNKIMHSMGPPSQICKMFKLFHRVCTTSFTRDHYFLPTFQEIKGDS